MGAAPPLIIQQTMECKAGKKLTIELKKVDEKSKPTTEQSDNAIVTINKNKIEIIPQRPGKGLVKIKYYQKFEPKQMEGPLYNLLVIELNIK